jgi:hypothetical protein
MDVLLQFWFYGEHPRRVVDIDASLTHGDAAEALIMICTV